MPTAARTITQKISFSLGQLFSADDVRGVLAREIRRESPAAAPRGIGGFYADGLPRKGQCLMKRNFSRAKNNRQSADVLRFTGNGQIGDGSVAHGVVVTFFNASFFSLSASGIDPILKERREELIPIFKSMRGLCLAIIGLFLCPLLRAAEIDLKLTTSDGSTQVSVVNSGAQTVAGMDSAGNVSFSSTLKPNGQPGTAGQVLQSQGASSLRPSGSPRRLFSAAIRF